MVPVRRALRGGMVRCGAGLIFVAVLVTGVLASVPATADPARATVKVGDAPLGCDANFIRPCRWTTSVTYGNGESPLGDWTMIFPPGFFFPPDEEVNDHSVLGNAKVLIRVEIPSVGCSTPVNATFPLYEATTNTANVIPDPEATVDGNTNGIIDGAEKYPAGIAGGNHDARYFGGSQHVYVNFNIDRLSDGSYSIVRHMFAQLPPNSGFCGAQEDHFFAALTLDNPGSTEVEEDEITTSCFVQGPKDIQMFLLGDFKLFRERCERLPPAPGGNPLHPPNVPPDQFTFAGTPDFGQHAANWCWATAAANTFYRMANNGFPRLLDEPGVPGADQRYLDVAGRMDIGSVAWASETPVTKPDRWRDSDSAGYRRLLRRIVQSVWGDSAVAGANNNSRRDPTEARYWFVSSGVNIWNQTVAFREFLSSARVGAKIRVIARSDAGPIIGCAETGGAITFPAGVEGTAAANRPTRADYIAGMVGSYGMLLALPGHMVTAVGYDVSPGTTGTIYIADSSTDDHRNDTAAPAAYDALPITNNVPLRVTYDGAEVNVQALILFQPRNASSP